MKGVWQVEQRGGCNVLKAKHKNETPKKAKRNKRRGKETRVLK